MIFRIYFHFAIYCYEYHILKNIYFNYLMSIKILISFENFIFKVLNYVIISIINEKAFKYGLDESFNIHNFERK